MSCDAHLADLTAEQRQRLQAQLEQFEQSWHDKLLAAKLRELPPIADPLRHALLVGLVCADMRARWKHGQRVKVEAYLKACPELGSVDTVGVALLEAEYEARKVSGARAEREDFARRFPRRVADSPLLSDAGQATAAEAGRTPGGKDTPDGPEPAAAGRTPVALPERFGRYHILRELGKGGMGTVHLAQDTQLDRRVALKVPHFLVGGGPAVRKRFLREARAAAALDHPNICPVYDAGQVDGVHYLTMAYIEGKSLAESLREGPRLSQRQAALLVRKLALALAEAHARSLVHRDMKPSNIMLNARGEPVIMDFGLARRLDRADARLTGDGVLLGTPAYMAPEQVTGDLGAIGPACDIYSLGVIFYELLTGTLPFRGPAGSIMVQVVTNTAPPVSAHRPDVDPRLEAVCAQALAKKPEDRPASMLQLAEALAAFLDEPETLPQADAEPEPPARAKKRHRKPVPAPAEEAGEEETDSRPRKRRRSTRELTGRRPWGLVAVVASIAVVASVLAAVVSVRMLSGGSQPDPVAPPGPAVLVGEREKPPPGVPRGWRKFSPPDSRLAIWLPGTPKPSKQVQETVLGKTENYLFQVQEGKNLYGIGYFDFPGIVPKGDAVDKALDGGVDGLLRSVEKARLLERRKITLDGYPGRETELELEIKGETVFLRVRMYVVQERCFQVLGHIPRADLPSKEFDAYFSSFRFVLQ